MNQANDQPISLDEISLQEMKSYTNLATNVDKHGRTDRDFEVDKRSFHITRKFVEVNIN